MDTGGFFDSQEDSISSLIKQKASEAAEKADILLFIVDGKRGLLPAEEELYASLKRLNKPILVVVNKVDSPAEEAKVGDFYRLGGGRIYPVSAEHKRNIELLESGLYMTLPFLGLEKEEVKPLRIALVGRINVGKSSIVNRLIGEERLIVSEIPGTTRDSVDTLIFRDKKAFCLVDTAGIRKLGRTRDKREKASIIKAKKDIAQADVVCMIMDAQEFPTRQDSAVAHLSLESGRPMVIALNKWDLVEKTSQTPEEFREKAYSRLDFISYAPLVFVSALTGKRVIKILDLAEKAYASGTRKVGTSRLNGFLSYVNKNHPPLSKKRGRMKIKYMTQKKILPPTFILFTHSSASLSPAYERFFIQLLRKEFGFEGTPIRLVLKRS